MSYYRKTILYLSPLLSACLLLLAWHLARRDEGGKHTAQPLPSQLQVACEPQLLEPVTAIVEAFQRRELIRVEIVSSAAIEKSYPSFGSPDLVLTLELSEGEECCSSGGLGAFLNLAAVRPVVLACPAAAPKLNNWSDLRADDLRLALPRRRKSALARSLERIMIGQNLPWPDLLKCASLIDDEEIALARAVITGSADAAVIWEPQALLFTNLLEMLVWPVKPDHLGIVRLQKNERMEAQAEIDRLAEFFAASLAKSLWQEYGYLEYNCNPGQEPASAKKAAANCDTP